MDKNSAGVNNAIAAVADKMTMAPNGQLSDRQRILNLRWGYYKREEYAGRAVDWNGNRCTSPIERDAISMRGYLPPGFEDHGATLPLEFRRPTTPLGLVRIVVARFTGLLFSDKRHPTMNVPGDQDTEDYLSALLKYGRFWSTMQKARNYGGGMGAVGVGFKFIDGKVVFECFDPRWAVPEFTSCDRRELESLEIRYTYDNRVRDRNGMLTRKFWYRRLIDAQTDTVWERVPVEDEEPNWNNLPGNCTEHNLGFVPAEWIQNIPSDEGVDGDPDCQGAYELSEAVDHLLSQAHRGTLLNSDPTVFISSDDDLPALSKGSDNALKMGAGSSAQYMEMNGQGANTAKTLSEMFEDRFYRLVQCVPESIMFANSSDKTATEIEREFSSMLEKSDVMRGQYGPCIESLCHKLIVAVRTMTSPRMGADGMTLQASEIVLPPRVVTEEVDDGSGYGTTISQTVEKPYMLGNGSIVVAKWGRYFPPSLNDIETATRTAQSAKDGQLLDRKSSITWLMPFYDLDSARVLEALDKEAADQAAQDEAAAVPEEPPSTTYSPAEIENGLVTINEVREGKGLGAIPDGDLTLPQYKAKNPELFVASTAATSTQAVDALFNEAGSAPKPGGFGKPAQTSPRNLPPAIPSPSNQQPVTSNQ